MADSTSGTVRLFFTTTFGDVAGLLDAEDFFDRVTAVEEARDAMKSERRGVPVSTVARIARDDQCRSLSNILTICVDGVGKDVLQEYIIGTLQDDGHIRALVPARVLNQFQRRIFDHFYSGCTAQLLETESAAASARGENQRADEIRTAIRLLAKFGTPLLLQESRKEAQKALAPSP